MITEEIVQRNEAAANKDIRRISIERADGSCEYLIDRGNIATVLNHLRALKIMWWETRPIDNVRKKYFLMLDELVKEGEIGYTKTELHHELKRIILPKIVDFPSYFFSGISTGSTNSLTHDGWVAFIEELKVEANHHFGYHFKN